jgi:hypothetical protein
MRKLTPTDRSVNVFPCRDSRLPGRDYRFPNRNRASEPQPLFPSRNREGAVPSN